MTDFRPFTVTYDPTSDVLYISARQVPATKGKQDKLGRVWRYDATGDLIGVTIMDFKERWAGKRDELARDLSRGFHVSEPEMKTVLQS